jgi:hypothetical protein
MKPDPLDWICAMIGAISLFVMLAAMLFMAPVLM